MVIKDIGQVRFLTADGFTFFAVRKGQSFLAEIAPRQSLENVENLLGVFLVLQQLAKVMQRLERAKAGFRAFRVDLQ